MIRVHLTHRIRAVADKHKAGDDHSSESQLKNSWQGQSAGVTSCKIVKNMSAFLDRFHVLLLVYLAHEDRVDFPDESPSHCLVAKTIITRLRNKW